MRNLTQSTYKGFIQIDKYEQKADGFIYKEDEIEYSIYDKRKPNLTIRVAIKEDGPSINWWGDGRATVEELRSFQRLLDIADELIREEY